MERLWNLLEVWPNGRSLHLVGVPLEGILESDLFLSHTMKQADSSVTHCHCEAQCHRCPEHQGQSVLICVGPNKHFLFLN